MEVLHSIDLTLNRTDVISLRRSTQVAKSTSTETMSLTGVSSEEYQAVHVCPRDLIQDLKDDT